MLLANLKQENCFERAVGDVSSLAIAIAKHTNYTVSYKHHTLLTSTLFVHLSSLH